MNKINLLTLSFLIGIAGLVYTAPAQAQATRTWVSGVGDDANPCSRTAPCKTFAGAISKTAASGEINCLDDAGYGGVTITKSIALICRGKVGGVLVSGTNAIIVNIAGSTGKVIIEGLDLQGIGTGLSGIAILSASQVFVRNTTIQGFATNGIRVNGPAGARVFVSDSEIILNGIGVNVQGASGANNAAILERTIVETNSTSALKIVGPATAILNNSTLSGSVTAIDATGGAVVTSYGNNVIRGSGLPTQTIPTL